MTATMEQVREGYGAWSLVATRDPERRDQREARITGARNWSLVAGAPRVRKAACDLLDRSDISISDVDITPLPAANEWQQDSFVDLRIDGGLVIRTRAVYRVTGESWVETPWLVAESRCCGTEYTADATLSGLADLFRRVQRCNCCSQDVAVAA